MWFDDFTPETGWSCLWQKLILCSCGAIRTYEDCPVCHTTIQSDPIEYLHESGKKIWIQPAFMGAEGRYEDWLYLDLIQREWLRPVSTLVGGSRRLSEISQHASVILLYWAYFESRIERILKLGLRAIREELRDDILNRYSGVGSRMDRLYKLIFGTTYFDDIRTVGAAPLVELLKEVQKKRNEFAHGHPTAITDELAQRVVASLRDEHFAWIAVFNLRVAASLRSQI